MIKTMVDIGSIMAITMKAPCKCSKFNAVVVSVLGDFFSTTLATASISSLKNLLMIPASRSFTITSPIGLVKMWFLGKPKQILNCFEHSREIWTLDTPNLEFKRERLDFIRKYGKQDRSHQWPTRPAHSPGRSVVIFRLILRFGTDGQQWNSDHYRPWLWLALWINNILKCWCSRCYEVL